MTGNPWSRLARRTVPLCVAVVACAGGTAGTGGGERELALTPQEGARRGLTLEVQNLNFYDAELYLVDESRHRERLGFVPGNATETFSFQWPPVRNLAVEIHLVSVGTYLSDGLPIEEGDELFLIIEPDLHQEQPVARRPGR